jgi:hypothetical protein
MKPHLPKTAAGFVRTAAVLAVLINGCVYMKMNPPADSDKPLPVPAGNNSCYLHAASNMLAGAGYGTGTTLQARADDIWADMSAQYGVNGGTGGWMDAALQWWLASPNNTWPGNPYTVVTVYGNKTRVPWANPGGARDIGNELRSCNLVGLSISWPDASQAGGTGGHSITAWGDNVDRTTALSTNPAGVRVTDSDTDTGGDVQAYTYDAYTNPNPGGVNEGQGWYFNYGTPHPFIKHIATLSRTSGPWGVNGARVIGSYRIHQRSRQPASDLHYRVGTDVDILTYRTSLDWIAPSPAITENQPRRELTVNWDLSKAKVPYCTWVTITTEFVEPFWNSISYHDVHFTYPDSMGRILPDLNWKMESTVISRADTIRNVTGGYIIGSFDVYNPRTPQEPAVQYRFVHQYLYNQSPESHTFLLTGTPGYTVKNLCFSHSYGCPTRQELWQQKSWMTRVEAADSLGEKPIRIPIDWKGRLPYPEGDRGAGDTDGGI